MGEYDVRGQIGRRVFSIAGKFPFMAIHEWEILEAPRYAGEKRVEHGAWLIGTRIFPDGGGKHRPQFIDIPWKRLAYPTGLGCFFASKEEALGVYALRCNISIQKLAPSKELPYC